MCRRQILSLLLAVTLLMTQSGCWSSKEIEDSSTITGLALDEGELSPVQQDFEDQGGDYPKRNKITATVQIVPTKSFGSASKTDTGKSPQYLNLSGTGDSVIEIFRQYSIRRDRPVIGHHLKVIIVSAKLAEQQKLRQVMDFVIHDNDIRPSCLVFLSAGRAADTLVTKYSGEIPSFQIRDLLRNNYRTSKVMKGVVLSELDALMNSKVSFVLQNIIEARGDIEFSGAGIIKGETGNWIGTLDQQDVESIAWIKGEVEGGVIKTYNWRNEPITYEIKTMKSKITTQITDGNNISFHVDIDSEGRITENWDVDESPSDMDYITKAEEAFEKRLTKMFNGLMQKMQSEYKVEVAGFGERLRIEEPQMWKKVKDHWDEKFSQSTVTFDIKLSITDFGSSTK